MPLTVAVQGDGVAACCAVQLLRKSKIPVRLKVNRRASPLTVLVSPSTQRLLQDVFDYPPLLQGLPVIDKRIILWGQQSEPLTLPHAGLAVSEASLLQRLWNRLEDGDTALPVEPNWRVISRNEGSMVDEQHFGSRRATAVEVQLREGSDPGACSIESLPAGWLFLLPSPSRKGSLLCVGGVPDALLGQSRLVARQVDSVSGSISSFAAYPRIAACLGAPGFLRCGTAAMGFDPLCGEGAGNAVREAILASAVLRALEDGENSRSVLQHYSSRLLAGFLRHLQSCREFYLSGRNGPWWDAELEQLETGIKWTGAQLSELPPTSFRLVDFNLQPLVHADKP